MAPNLNHSPTVLDHDTKLTCDLFHATPEELAEDERIWDEKFANTTPEQLARLIAMFEADALEGTIPIEQMFEEEDAEEAAALHRASA